jgi:hypothetical protein
MINKFAMDSGDIPQESDRGSSSVLGTQRLRVQLPELFIKYNITSMFDAGCSDGTWAWLLCDFVEYHGGEINPELVKTANTRYPELDISVFDVLTNQLPRVDLLFMRDVSIHFSNREKKIFLQNFKQSNIPWILITNMNDALINTDIAEQQEIQTAITNWCLPPWNWPAPTESAWEYAPGGRSMSLWHRDQLQHLL